MGNTCQKYQNGQVWGPWHKEWDFVTIWIVKESTLQEDLYGKMLLESKTLLSSNIFHTNPLHFPKIQIMVETYSFFPGASNLASLVFSMRSFHFWEKFGHVTPAAKGLLKRILLPRYSPAFGRHLGSFHVLKMLIAMVIMLWFVMWRTGLIHTFFIQPQFSIKAVILRLGDLWFPLLLLQERHLITPLKISHIMKINSFTITQRKTSWIYLVIAVFITSKFPSSYQTLAGISPESIATEK